MVKIVKSLYFNQPGHQGYKHRTHRSKKNQKNKWEIDRLKNQTMKRHKEEIKSEWAHKRIKHAFIGKNLGKERESF